MVQNYLMGVFGAHYTSIASMLRGGYGADRLYQAYRIQGLPFTRADFRRFAGFERSEAEDEIQIGRFHQKGFMPASLISERFPHQTDNWLYRFQYSAYNTLTGQLEGGYVMMGSDKFLRNEDALAAIKDTMQTDNVKYPLENLSLRIIKVYGDASKR